MFNNQCLKKEEEKKKPLKAQKIEDKKTNYE